MKNITLIASLSILVGCAGAPVGWGGTHSAVQANDKSVTYVYDPFVGGYSATMNAATAHCSIYGKSAVPTFAGKQGLLSTQTFECR